MASDRQKFRVAVAKHEMLRREKHCSVPPEFGKTAIVSSVFTDEDLDTERGVTELESFRREAYSLADLVIARAGTPELAVDASRDDIDRIIKDPDISDIYVIGNGSLSTLILDVRDYYDWLNVSEATDHLKLGKFIQRQCGGLTRSFNVPMGLFAVCRPSDVHAALDDAFYPASLDDPVNEKIQPVLNMARPVTYEEIKAITIPEGM